MNGHDVPCQADAPRVHAPENPRAHTLLKLLTATTAFLAAACVALVVANPSDAAFPGENGKIAFESDRDGNSEIYTMNPDGSDQTNVTNNPASDNAPTISPNGRRIAFTSDRDGDSEIFTMNADGSDVTQVTDNDDFDFGPAWSPDGRRLAFTSNRDDENSGFNNFDIYTIRVDGEGLQRVTNNANFDFSPDWSPDGRSIAFESDRGNGNPDQEIYTINLQRREVVNVSNNDFDDFSPSYSPDGERIVYQSCRPEEGSTRACGFNATPGDEGDFDIVTANVDGTDQVSLTRDTPEIIDNYTPSWSPDGERIAYSVANDRSFDEVEIFSMDASDGSDKRRLTQNPNASDFGLDWGPRVAENPPPNNPNKCTIVGTRKSDVLRGTPRRDVICGLGGGDVIRGFGGDDRLVGGAGDDAIYGGSGNDALLGGPGDDVLRGEGGRDRFAPGPGRDSVRQ